MGNLIEEPRALIVELIGTPAAGKTTLLPALEAHFKLQRLQAWSVIEAARPFAQRTLPGRIVSALAPRSLQRPLLWQVFYQISRIHRVKFHLEHRALMDATLRFQHERPISEADRRHVLHWFVNLTGQYSLLKERSRAGEVLIFEEGFVHRVVQLFASEVEPVDAARIRDYLCQIPVPDLIIRPVASPETCVERVYLRGVWERFRNRDRAAVTRFIHNAHAAVDIAMEHAAAENWPVVQVLNENRPASESIHDLSRKLSSRYATAFHKAALPINA